MFFSQNSNFFTATWRRKAVCIAFFVLFSSAYRAFAATSPPLHTPDIQTAVLSNGLTLMVVENNRVPLVMQSITYKVGSMDEQPDERGIAHLLEHMMFRGLKSMSEEEITSMYARFGNVYNASTSKDSTSYYQKFLPYHLEESIAFEAKRMQDLTLDPQKFIAERQVVKEERDQRITNNVFQQMREEEQGLLYRVHSYRYPVIGFHDDIRNLTRQKTLAFYRQHYRPSNAMISVVGDVSFAEVLRLVRQYFGMIKNPEQQKSVNQNDFFEPPQTALIVHEAVTDKVVTPSISLIWKTPNFSSTIASLAEDDFRHQILESYAKETALSKDVSRRHVLALLIGADILGNVGGAVAQELVEEKRIADKFGASSQIWTRGPGSFRLYIEAASSDTSYEELGKALAVSLQGDAPLFTPESIEQSKQSILLSLAYSLDSLPELTNFIRNIFLQDITQRDELEEFLSLLQSIEPQEVTNAFATYWEHTPYLMSVMLPTPNPL